MSDYRDLTPEEIEALPLDLQACFDVQGWNISAKINNIGDWAETFWQLFIDIYDADSEKEKKAKQRMYKAFAKAYRLRYAEHRITELEDVVLKYFEALDWYFSLNASNTQEEFKNRNNLLNDAQKRLRKAVESK